MTTRKPIGWLRTHPRWMRWVMGCWLGIALLVPFLANDKALVAHYQGHWYFPVVQQWAVQAGMGRFDEMLRIPLHEKPPGYRVVVGPLIPYRAETLDASNGNYRSPFGPQQVSSWYYRHWLGTDQLGRDTLAGLLYGARIAWWVGMGAMVLSVVLGLLLGLLAGYYANDRLRISRSVVGSTLIFLGAGVVWQTGWTIPHPTGWSWLVTLMVLAGLGMVCWWLLQRLSWGRRLLVIPLDRWFLALVGWFKSLPGMVVVMAILPLFKSTGIWSLALLIGLFRWPLIGQYVRAEVLRIRHLPFMESVRLLGLADRKILWKHALPNVWPPVVVNAAFGVGAAVAVESALSFLGLGLGLQQVTWGTLLNAGRHYFPAWWLVVFPGVAIFMVVYVCNVLGDRWLARYEAGTPSSDGPS